MIADYSQIEAIKENIITLASDLLKRYGLRLNPPKKRIIDLRKSNHVRITGISKMKDGTFIITRNF